MRAPRKDAVMVAFQRSRGTGRSAGWISLVGLVVAVALVGSSCGSGSSSDAPQAVERWQLSFTSVDGQTLPKVTLKNGQQVPQLVVDGAYVVNATVPSSLRSELDGKTVELQRRAGADGDWTTVTEVQVGDDGVIREEFTAGNALIHQGDFRIAVLASGSSPTTEGAMGNDAGVRLVSATQLAQSTAATFATSDTSSAVGVVQFVVQLRNDTNNNLNIYVPTDASNGKYNEAEVSIASGETQSLLYTNPAPGMQIHFRVNKDKCLGGCTNYITNWSWHPQASSVSACSASMPKFVSNQVYKVELTDKIGDSGFAAGLISGPIGGAGAGDSNCFFRLESGFVNWLENSKVAGYIETAVEVAAVVAVFVAICVLTDGAASLGTEETMAVVEGLIEDGVVDEVAADPVVDQAGGTADTSIDKASGAQDLTWFRDNTFEPPTNTPEQEAANLARLFEPAG